MAVPTTPAAKLSAPTTKPSSDRSLSSNATDEKARFVIKTSKAPMINVIFTPNFFTNRPPKKKPNIEAITATTLTT